MLWYEPSSGWITSACRYTMSKSRLQQNTLPSAMMVDERLSSTHVACRHAALGTFWASSPHSPAQLRLVGWWLAVDDTTKICERERTVRSWCVDVFASFYSPRAVTYHHTRLCRFSSCSSPGLEEVYDKISFEFEFWISCCLHVVANGCVPGWSCLARVAFFGFPRFPFSFRGKLGFGLHLGCI